jgi:hypothetical protein
MIRDPDIAKQLLGELFDVSGRLDQSVAVVRDGCSEAELVAYRRAIGQVMGEMWDQVLKPLLTLHPALTPPELRNTDA